MAYCTNRQHVFLFLRGPHGSFLLLSPDDPDMHFSADTQAQWVRNRARRTLGSKMNFNGFARPDEAQTWPTRPVPARPPA